MRTESEASAATGSGAGATSRAPRGRRGAIEYDDGPFPRGLMGFIVLATDLIVEENMFRMAPAGVGVSFSRLRTDNATTVENLAKHLDHMAEAAAILQPDARPSTICYACTSGSIVIGPERIKAEIKRGAPASTPTTLVSGVVAALRAVGAKRLAVATPYIDEINRLEADFLRREGFEIAGIEGLQVVDGAAMGRIAPGYIRDFALGLDRPDADAIFVSCSAIRTIDVLQEIEDRVGKPVISSNQAMMWHCLRLAGIDDAIANFGSLFQRG